MRTAIVTLILAALLPAGAAFAHDHELNFGSCQVREPVEWGARHDLRRARFAMLTEDRSAELVLTRDLVAIQLSGRIIGKLDHDLARERDEDDGVIAGALKGAILGSVRALLDHSLECPLDELRDVRYRDGRLEFITEDGDRIFEDLRIDDREVLECFQAADARAFVHKFRRLKGRGL
jgi:hypothetical protein